MAIEFILSLVLPPIISVGGYFILAHTRIAIISEKQNMLEQRVLQAESSIPQMQTANNAVLLELAKLHGMIENLAAQERNTSAQLSEIKAYLNNSQQPNSQARIL